MRRHTRGYDALFFLAILATLFALAPGMAHVLEMPRKLLLAREAYFTVQQIYAGWSLFGIVILIQCAALALLAWRSRRDTGARAGADRLYAALFARVQAAGR